jgi:predicted dehydrogenase
MGPVGNLHADCYVSSPHCELIGVCDIIKERADAASARLGVPAFYDAQEMLGRLRPDTCGICTGGYEYGSDHYVPTMQAFEAGCHVLGEKPISNEVCPAQEMVAKAREKRVCYGINFNHRFTRLARIAKEWLNQGRLGHVLFVNMSMWIKNATETSPWFQIKALNPHSVDILRYFCGDIVAVHCFAVKAPGRSIWSTAHFNVKFANGAVGGLTGSYDIERGHPMERCEVAGTQGRFVLEDMFGELTLYPTGTAEKTVITNTPFGLIPEKTFNDTFQNRIHRFAEQVASGCSPDEIEASGADGLAAQKVLEAAIESIQSGTVVTIPQ